MKPLRTVRNYGAKEENLQAIKGGLLLGFIILAIISLFVASDYFADTVSAQSNIIICTQGPSGTLCAPE